MELNRNNYPEENEFNKENETNSQENSNRIKRIKIQTEQTIIK